MPNAVLCIASKPVQTEGLLLCLRTLGVATSEISLLFPDRPTASQYGTMRPWSEVERPTIGSGAGGLAGGMFGLLAGAGILTIPGAGLFIAAGPIIAALSGVALGVAVGGISQALVGMGVPQSRARKYEAKVNAGATLLTVHAVGKKEARRIRQLMSWVHVEDIAVVESPLPDAVSVIAATGE